MPAAPLTTRPSWITPPPSPVPTIAETDERACASAPKYAWWAYSAAALPSLLYTTGSPSRACRAPRMSKPRHSGWEKLVDPLEEITPSALAGPGVSSPTAATRERSMPVSARIPSSASASASTATTGPSSTRLGVSTIRSTRNRPELSSTVALLAVPPLSRPTTTRSLMHSLRFAPRPHADAHSCVVASAGIVPASARLGGRHTRRPFLLDAPVPPDDEGHDPGEHEEADDHVADLVEVEVPDRGERPPADVEPVGDDRDQLDGTDDQRDGDREPGDHDVVVDLAYWTGERPAVREVHEAAVDGVEQAHPRGEEYGQGQDRVPGQVEHRRPAREYQQGDLGRGVEPEPEQQPDRVHLPGLVDRLRGPGQDPVDEAALVEVVLERGLVVRPAAHLPEDLDDPDQDHQVDDPDEVEEDAGDRGADQAGRALQRRAVVLDLTGQR